MKLSANCRRVTVLVAMLLATVTLFTACDGGDDPTDNTSMSDSTTLTEKETDTNVEDNGSTAEGDTESGAETESESSTEAKEVVYYVCTDPKDPEGTVYRVPTEKLSNAKRLCDYVAQEGYRVVSSEGETVYTPYPEWQCDLLRECKWVTDYVRENKFIYGDAPINPAMNHVAKKVSCDRFVCWALYRIGYTNQPSTQGVVVSRMAQWCEENGFQRIDNQEDLQPGDVVLAQWNGSHPAHTFIYAGKKARTEGQFYRYDCGSNARIQSIQPSCEGITDFWRAYRAPGYGPGNPNEGYTGRK